MPPKAKKDQGAPAPVSPSGVAQRGPLGVDAGAQAGNILTTAQGLRLSDSDHSLKAGPRGPSLLEDFHLREKITHFDHERIPERVVHARGAAAHGTFTAYGSGASATKAEFLARRGLVTPVFVRFSTVLGSRGSADTARDVRGFAVKFYTTEGVMDLVGNNMPIFFIQDGLKFPDLIHAAKPQPDRELPQAATAHDTFWDFVSLHTESMHQVIWAMSDRGIPRSYRTMAGFGIHTFRLVNAKGATVLAKFHWTPAAGVHSLVWEEAQIAAGCDPDYHRRDLADAIEAGGYPEWELGLQLFPDTEEETFEGIDLLDPTKLVPEELAPVQPIGRLRLDRNPVNYFAETEQVAFCTQHVVPGIQFTNDPLLQARNFSYLDTQLTRLGGPNFAQLPINRPHVPVNDNHRDGMHQTLIHSGVTAYLPNGLDGDQPLRVGEADGGYVTVSTATQGTKVRESPVSFGDHFSQAAMFWASMSELEQAHIVASYTFELSKVYEMAIRERMLANLANINADLCAQVATGLGMAAPKGNPPTDVVASAALTQITGLPGPITGRVIGILVAPGADLAAVAALQKAILAKGATPRVVAPVGGTVVSGRRRVVVERALAATRSIEYDALIVADGTAGVRDIKLTVLLQEMWRHLKVIAAVGNGAQVLTDAGIDLGSPGVLTSDASSAAFTKVVLGQVALHRVWDRAPAVMASY